MRTMTIAILALLLLPGVPPARAAGPAALEPLAFLLGTWPSTGTGKPGEGAGTAVFTRSLQDQVILRTSFAEYPATESRPKSRHDDLMIIYVAPGGGVRADFHDSEGHTIRYAVETPAPGKAIFVSDESAGGPRFRLTYALESAGVMKGRFEIAPPGSPDGFKPYLTWTSRRGGAAE